MTNKAGWSLRFTQLSLTVLAISGCATPPPAAKAEPDHVEAIIASYADSATKSLRTWSETEGRSRVTTVDNGLSAKEEIVPMPLSAPRVQAPQGVAYIDQQLTSTGGLLSDAPDGLTRLLVIRNSTWDVEDLIARICTEVGWNKGPSTGLKISPVLLTIETKKRPAYEVLRDIGAMTGESATIVVSANKTISIRYPQR